jgi:hypothetical protein
MRDSLITRVSRIRGIYYHVLLSLDSLRLNQLFLPLINFIFNDILWFCVFCSPITKILKFPYIYDIEKFFLYVFSLLWICFSYHSVTEVRANVLAPGSAKGLGSGIHPRKTIKGRRSFINSSLSVTEERNKGKLGHFHVVVQVVLAWLWSGWILIHVIISARLCRDLLVPSKSLLLST